MTYKLKNDLDLKNTDLKISVPMAYKAYADKSVMDSNVGRASMLSTSQKFYVNI